MSIASVGLFATACDVHGISSGTVGALSTITVSPNPQSLLINGTQQFTAVGRDAAGANVAITPVWSIVTGGGTISTTGMFTAGTLPGTYTNTVKATSGGISGTATIIVTIGPLATITVTPNPATLAIGATQQFTAVGKDASGNVVAITPTWSVIAAGGTVSATGLFTAGNAVGTFANTVQASSGGINGTATVTVTAGPVATIVVTPNPVTLAGNTTQTFTAVGRDAGGNVVAITPAWSVVNAGGTIDATSGLFTAGVTTGTFTNTVKATSGAISGFATVTVTAPVPVLTTIAVSPNPATMLPNATQQFTAVGTDNNGNPIAITPVWSVVNGGGTISATGLFTAGATTGTFTNTVRATSGAVSGTATVIVSAVVVPILTTITVTPNPASVTANATQLFTAVGRDANGNVMVITPVWTITAGGGTINAASGLFTAGAVTGTFTNTVRATSGVVFGTSTVIVTAVVPPPIVNLGSAAPNGIMAGTAFTCVIGGVINANISISPGSTVTGFPPCVITGVQHLADAVALQAQIDLTAAYNVLAGLPCPPANAIVANLGGTTKPAGVYCTATSIGVTGNLILDGGGDPNATFVFQAGTSLITAGNIVLINGAQAKNVYWQVGSSATIGTASQWQGNILALTSITLVDNANLIGRALARNGAVSLGTNNIITLP
ncbi:MAG: ice-binding family protein [Gemmatimonadaceae bacterium]